MEYFFNSLKLTDIVKYIFPHRKFDSNIRESFFFFLKLLLD